MIYASDLDRTLIFSQSYLKEHTTNEDMTLVDVSTVNSYIAKSVQNRLEEITKNKGVRFIPVTTRNISEYKRIKLGAITPKYAITSNGGTILYNNEILKDWENIVASKLNLEEMQEIANEINELPNITREAHFIDNVYIMAKTSAADTIKEEIDNLNKKYQQYSIYIHKAKVYVIPKFVTKDSALMWLKQYLNEDIIVASGDSPLDIPMLDIADYAYIPSDSSIINENMDKNGYIRVSGGITGALEVMDSIQNIINEQHKEPKNILKRLFTFKDKKKNE